MVSTTMCCVLPDGSAKRLKVRSMVGLLPLCATTVIEQWQRERVPRVVKRHCKNGCSVCPSCATPYIQTSGVNGDVADRGIAALVNQDRLRRILTRTLDEKEFLSPYGVRALSRYHEDHPYIVRVDGQEYRVNYLPAESDSGMFGGNSNWRGPVWMPMNVLLIRALLQFYLYYGDNFKIECPTGSGNPMNLFEVAREISDRLARIFLRDKTGRRPVFGGTEKFQTDPQWKDYLLFYEYFHGDNGAGLGASHQTGWTGLVVMLTELFGRVDPRQLLDTGKPGFKETVANSRLTWQTENEVTCMTAITVEPKKPYSAKWEEVQEPDIREGSVLVETIAVGVCGTDVKIMEGKYGWAPPGKTRLILGRESLGRVLESDSAGRFKKGDLVVGIVRRPDPVPCPNCAVGEWDMCRNGQYTERGIKQLNGFMAERWRIESEYAMKVDGSLGLLGVLGLRPSSPRHGSKSPP